MTYYNPFVAAHLFLINEQKIMMLRRFNTGYQDGKYSVPAGHVDEHEKATNAIVRESLEEIGVLLNVEDIELAHVMHRLDQSDRIDYFFVAHKWSGTPRNCEPHKSDYIGWQDLNSLPSNTIPYVAFAIAQYKTGSIFSEFGWNES